jgi:hypothetical protein
MESQGSGSDGFLYNEDVDMIQNIKTVECTEQTVYRLALRNVSVMTPLLCWSTVSSVAMLEYSQLHGTHSVLLSSSGCGRNE